jgi:tRNA U34 5-carboxymethylaminomethyl modifying GTPase MnmE/TrmE
MLYSDSIVALATPSGAGAIAVIRISGPEAITIGNSVFKSIKNKDLSKQKTHTLHLGHIMDDKKTLDEVLVSIFKGLTPTPVKIRSRYPATVPRIFNNRLYSCCCWMPHG